MDIMMNSSGDLVATNFGDIAILSSENDDIIQTSKHNVLTVLGELVLHPYIGNDAFNKRLNASASGFSTIAEDSKRAILLDDRVATVTHINAYSGDVGQCIIDYTLETVNGDTLSCKVVQEYK